jgi:hypothetical protein
MKYANEMSSREEYEKQSDKSYTVVTTPVKFVTRFEPVTRFVLNDTSLGFLQALYSKGTMTASIKFCVYS